MAVTRSSVASRSDEARRAAPVRRTAWRSAELVWLMLAALIVCGAWALVYTAKVRRSTTPAPVRESCRNSIAPRNSFPCSRCCRARRIAISRRSKSSIFWPTATASCPIPALSRASEFRARIWSETRKLEELRKRAEDAKGNTIALFTPAEFAQIKPQIAVRGIDVFRRDFLLWAGAILGGFPAHAYRLERAGIHRPVGVFASAADPHRNRLCAHDRIARSAAGHADFRALRPRRGGRLPRDAGSRASSIGKARCRATALCLCWARLCFRIALIFLGSGPAGSDARVNLGPFQPVEAIKILLVFFLAGYFARRWPLLRELREKRSIVARIVPSARNPAIRVCGSRC